MIGAYFPKKFIPEIMQSVELEGYSEKSLAWRPRSVAITRDPTKLPFRFQPPPLHPRISKEAGGDERDMIGE